MEQFMVIVSAFTISLYGPKNYKIF